MRSLCILLTILFPIITRYVGAQLLDDEGCAAQWAQKVNQEYLKLYNLASTAAWNRVTNITKETSKKSLEVNLSVTKRKNEISKLAKIFNWKNFTNDRLRREFSYYAGKPINETLMKKMQTVQMQMEDIYNSAKVVKDGRYFALNPELTKIMANSQDYNELLWAWKSWRDETGKKMRTLYIDYITYLGQKARENGYKTAADMKVSKYDDPQFATDMKRVLESLQPLYKLLHGYIRKKLRMRYPKKYFPKSGLIPAHLFGNMWAQSWINLQQFVSPFPNATNTNITRSMEEQNYTPKKMFEVSDDFFRSLGLGPMPPSFWKKSLIVNPKDGRKMACSGSAWNFFQSDDVRIKLCTDVTYSHFLTVHHEMGHIQYYMQYKDQPVVFQLGANPGFHEAIGDTITLSVQSPAHLKRVNLIKDFQDNNETDINYLMTIALKKIAFLPFGYLIDAWRWKLYQDEDVSKVDLNKRWWDLRCKHQGISPPVMRSEKDFDPGAKYHISADVSYIRYFFTNIFQFQLHKAMCKAKGHSGPLYKCSIYKSKEAGKVLSDGLKLGRSQPWQDVMEKMTGDRQLNTSAILEFFQPLIDWLKKELKSENLGWEHKCPGPEFYATLNASGPSRTSVVLLLVSVVSTTMIAFFFG